MTKEATSLEVTKIQNADISDPFFINSSDLSILKIVSTPLNGDNYYGWKKSMKRALNAKNKFGFVDGTIIEPEKETDLEAWKVWYRCNDMVVTWIQNSVETDISDSITFSDVAKDIWDDLEERFSQVNLPRIFEIQREITSFRQGAMSVRVYYSKIKGLWDQLAAIDPKLKGTEEQNLIQFLMGLNDTYQVVRGQILLNNPIPTVRQAYGSILQEEKQRSLTVHDDSTDLVQNAAMAVAQRPSTPRQNPSSQFRNRMPLANQGQFHVENFDAENFRSTQNSYHGERNRPKCTYCKKLGHKIQTCYKLHGPPRDNNGSRNSRRVINNVSHSGGATISLSDDQYQKYIAFLESQIEAAEPKINAVNNKGSRDEDEDWLG